jgi:hypothetical protein
MVKSGQNIWKHSRNKTGQKTACPDRATFSQIWNKKSQDLRSGSCLDLIWAIQIFGYLDIYAKKAITGATQYL